MWGGWNGEKEDVRKLLAILLGADKEEIAIIHNTSEGMNIFARSFNLREGDEVILADHEHRTGVAPFEYFCQGRGVKLIRPVLPVLPESGEETLRCISQGNNTSYKAYLNGPYDQYQRNDSPC